MFKDNDLFVSIYTMPGVEKQHKTIDTCKKLSQLRRISI